MFDLKAQRILIVDDMQPARTALRNVAQQAGGFQIETAISCTDAIARIRNGLNPDVVLCDYNLGTGRNGQQLFEELRYLGLVCEKTIWLMVTAESSYDRVISVADLIPDGYLLKPFSGEELKTRLSRIAAKKKLLASFYKLREKGDIQQAQIELDQLSGTPIAKQYASEIARLRIELRIENKQFVEAEQILKSIPAPVLPPWGGAALARCALSRQSHKEAIDILQALTQNHPDYLVALDLKAQAHSVLGEHAEAQKTLQMVVARNPLNWRRQQKLSQVALRNGDHLVAKQAAESFHRHAVTPHAVKPEDHFHMARIHQAGGDLAAANASLAKIPDSFGLIERIAAGAIRAIADPSDSDIIVHERAAILAIEHPAEMWGVNVVHAALMIQDIELAELVAGRLLSHPKTTKCFLRLREIYRMRGREDELREIQKRAARVLIGRD